MKRLETFAATIFGSLFVLLAVLVAVETGARKILNISLQGVNELSGYILAVSSALAFAIALLARTHVRIDLVYNRLPPPAKLILNGFSVSALAVCALALLRMAYLAWSDSVLFNSTAQTPWATPLRYPQAVWVAALAVFSLVAVAGLGRFAWLVVRGRRGAADAEFGPRGSDEELQEEMESIRSRGVIQDAASQEIAR
jgi:TRAP-type C4-dicarboxylate transport system permease small subunit